MISREDIRVAVDTIRPFVHRTPLLYSNSLSALTRAEVYLKAENLQKTGSFKVRGAFNKMCRLQGEKVIAASMGNHAQAVAYAARQLGMQATIVMPATASLIKEEATRGYGAEVVLVGEGLQNAIEHALSRKDHLFIHPFDDEEIIAGQGTVGTEIIEDAGDIDAVLVPVGGGGLVAGIAVAVKAHSPRTKVIGVQSASANSAYLSFRNGQITASPPSPTIADGIAVGKVGARPYEIMREFVDDILVVDEDPIATAILLLMERKKLVIEGAGAVALAGLLHHNDRFRDARVVLVLSGGNIDFTLVDRIIHKGLVASGRVALVEVTLDNIPGTLHALTGVIASHRANILSVAHEITDDLSVSEARLRLMVETKGSEHLEEILSDLTTKGYRVSHR